MIDIKINIDEGQQADVIAKMTSASSTIANKLEECAKIASEADMFGVQAYLLNMAERMRKPLIGLSSLKPLIDTKEEFKPSIKVASFKPSGKYYSENVSFLAPEHCTIPGYELFDLIKRNDHSVKTYSGLSSRFSGNFIFVIEVDYGPQKNFCYFALNSTI